MRTIVYTAILGGSDSLKPAPKGADCYCFVDDDAGDVKRNGWTLMGPWDCSADPRREAWKLRCLPHRIWDDYSTVVWVDASFRINDLSKLLNDAHGSRIAALRHHERTNCYWEANRLARIGQSKIADISRQLSDYQAERFDPTHLSVSCILVRDNSKATNRFNETWDTQIRKYPGDNTQVSLDYSAWKNGISIKALDGTRHQNPYAIHDTKDHQRRRKPYAMEASL